MPDALTPLALPTVKPNVLAAQWLDMVRLETTFNVDTSLSHETGVEQRRLLGDRPVRTQTVRMVGLDRKRSTMLVGNLLRAASQVQPTPIYCDQAVTTGASSNTNLPCPTTLRRFFVGGRILVHHFDADGVPTGAEYGIIDAIPSSAALTIRAPGLLLAHAAGSIVYPCMDSEISLSGGFVLRNDAVGEGSPVWMECYGKSALPVIGTFEAVPPGSTTYAPPGESTSVLLPVLTRAPNWGQEPAVSISRPGERFAVGRGQQVETYLPRPLFSFMLQYLEVSRDAAWEVILFWHSRCGSHLPFMLPNPQVLWQFRQQNGADEIWIEPYGNVDDIKDFVRFVMFRRTSGAIDTMKLLDAALDGDHFVLTVDALPGIADNLIAEVTSGHLVRFKTDSLSEEWLTDGVCSISLEATEIAEEIASTVTDIEVLT